MKKISIGLIGLLAIILVVIVACDKNEDATPQLTSEILSKKGGKGNNSGISADSAFIIYKDSLYNACGMWLSDTGSWYPTVVVNNIRWYHHTSYSSPTTTYDVLVMDFDVPTIPGKTVSSYLLFADQCSGRPACSKMNGIFMSQVTAGYTVNRFWLPIGTVWLNPYVVSYTGVICVVTTDGCMYLSQPFTFEPPRIL